MEKNVASACQTVSLSRVSFDRGGASPAVSSTKPSRRQKLASGMPAWRAMRMASEAGIVGFCRDITVTKGMLRQMYGVGYDGVSKTDRLLDFSAALSSAIYFVSSSDALLALGISPADPGQEASRQFPLISL